MTSKTEGSIPIFNIEDHDEDLAHDYEHGLSSYEAVFEVLRLLLEQTNTSNEDENYQFFLKYLATAEIIGGLIAKDLEAFILDYPNPGRNDLPASYFYSPSANTWLLNGLQVKEDDIAFTPIFFDNMKYDEFFQTMKSKNAASLSNDAKNLGSYTEWLIGLMSNDSKPEKSKKEYHREAEDKFNKKISVRQWDIAWKLAINKSGNENWSKPGPRTNKSEQ